MLNLPAMPLKLECKRCKKLYLHQAIANHQTVCCPICHKTTVLHGLAETADLVRHPFSFIFSYFKPSWHKRGKVH